MQVQRFKRKNLLSIFLIVLFTLCFSTLAINQLEAINIPNDAKPISVAEDLFAADLQISKSDGEATVTAGETITYSINFTNGSGVDASSVVLTETVPANTTFRPEASTAGWNCTPDNDAESICTLSIGDVLSGNGGQVNFAVKVDKPLTAGVTQIINTVEIGEDSPGSDPNPGDNTDTDNTPLALPDLQVKKDDGGMTVTAGDTINYTISFTNTSDVDTSGVVLTETVPANTTFRPEASTDGWNCTPDNDAESICTLGIGDVSGSNGGGQVDFAVEVDSGLSASVTEIVNTVAIGDDGAMGSDDNIANNTDTDTTPIGVADLSLTKDVSDASPFVGDTVIFTTNIANSGPSDASGVSVSDLLPDGYIYVHDNGGGAYDHTSGIWTIGNITNGGSETLSVTAEVLAAGNYDNYAQVATSDQLDLDSTPGDNSQGDDDDDTASTLPKPNADLELIKLDDPNPVIAGELLTYTLLITNHGPSAAQGILVTDDLPLESVTFESATDTCDFTYPEPVSCELENELEAGADVMVSIVVRVKPLVTGLITNESEVAITGPQIDRNPDNDKKTIYTSVIRQGDLLLTKKDEIDPVVAGTYLTYTVSISNSGPSGVTNVVLEDTLPSEVAFISATPSRGDCDEDDGVLTCTLGDFDVLDKVDIEYVVHVDPTAISGPISNKAVVNGNGTNPGVAIEDTLVKSEADLSLNKTASSNQITSGDNLTYTLEIINDGPSLARGVQVMDNLPLGVSLISTTVSDGSCNENGVFGCDLGNLNVKDKATVMIVVRVDLVGPGWLENTASVDSQTTDPKDQNNNGTASTFVAKRIYFEYLPIVKVQRISGEPNDRCDAAASIDVNQDYHFLPEDQHDWYQFDLPSSGELVVELRNFVPQKGQLSIYRGNDCLTRVFLGMDGSISSIKVVDLANQPAGHYYIYVSNDAGPSTEPYLLHVNFKP